MRSNLFASGLAILLCRGFANVLGVGGLSIGAVVMPEGVTAQSTASLQSQPEQLLAKGKEQYRRADFRSAIATCKQALTLARQNGDRATQIDALLQLGSIDFSIGHVPESEANLRQGLNLAKESSDRRREGELMASIGIIARQKGQYSQAMELLTQSLAIAQQVKNPRGETQSRLAIGTVLYLQNQYPQAMEVFQQALKIAKALPDQEATAYVQAWLTINYAATKDFKQAEAMSLQQQALSRSIGHRLAEYEGLSAIVVLKQQQKNPDQVLQTYQQQLAIAQSANNPWFQKDMLGNIGLAYYGLGENQKALEYYNQALPILRAVGNRSGEGTTFHNIGLVYSNLGEMQKALEYYNQALPIRRAVGDRSGEATTLNYIGLVYSNLGEKQKALEYYNQTLPIFRAVGDRSGEAGTLGGIGLVYSDLGEKQKALEYYNQALLLRRTVGDRSGEATTLNNIGGVYYALGEKQKALEYYNQALPIRRASPDRSGEATILANIGVVYSSLGEKQKALKSFDQVLLIFRAVGDRSSEATTLNNISRIYDDLGEKQKALKYHNQALLIHRAVGNRNGEATVLYNIGGIYYELGEKQKALDYYHQALPILSVVGDRSTEAMTLNNIALVLTSQNQPQLAIVFYKKSVTIYETLRQDIRTLPKETQQTYTKSVEGPYRVLADLLLKNDRILEAQQVLDLLKVQELNNYLKNVRGASQPLENLPPETEILKQYTTIQTSAIALGQELSTLRQTPEPSRSPQQLQRITQLDQLQRELNQQFNGFTDRPDIKTLIESLSPKVRRQTIDTADLNALRANLKQLNAVMIYPLILDDRLELIITTPDSPPLRRTVNVKREDLNKAILDFRMALERNDDRIDSYAQKLYAWLIKPLEADLKASNPKTLIYAPDGPLRYIPIAALHDGKQWLIERYAINHITAKSLTNFTQQPQQKPKILAGAIGGKTSEGTKVIVGTRSFDFAGLPGTNVEIDRIQALQPTTQILKETQFTLPKLLPQFADYNILHLATHAAIVPGNPEDSFILFSGKTTATLKDIENWDLNSFDLVILSACQTGLAGNFGTNGEEVLGLGYQFQNRGAKATIASLWKVDDNSTQQLMTEFYRALKAGKTKNKALQAAQLALISGTATKATGDRSSIEVKYIGKESPKSAGPTDAPHRHPYYWAPFILIGNGL